MTFPETEKDKEAVKLLKIIKERMAEFNTVTIDGKKFPASVEMELKIIDKRTGNYEVFKI